MPSQDDPHPMVVPTHKISKPRIPGAHSRAWRGQVQPPDSRARAPFISRERSTGPRVAWLAGGALAWRLVLFNPFAARGAYDALEGLAYGVGIGMLPAAALAVLAGRVRARWVLVAAALAAFGTDIATAAVAQASPSSTAGVALILAPLLELVTVVPATILLCRLTSAGRDG
jgi:hypothetical protein